ncbi:MAG: D-alanine--D-alanine ligase [Campylobacterota bacterium]
MDTVLFGGSSFEHEISIVSAITITKLIEPKHCIFMDAHNGLFLIDRQNMRSNFFSSGAYKKCKKLLLCSEGFMVEGFFKPKKLETGTVLNLIHGRDGEDGKVASLMEFSHTSYIGPRLEASALSYSKLLTKLYAQHIGVKTLEYNIVDKDNKKISLDFPVIVKPLRLGSSIGVSIAKDAAQLEFALDVAFEFDTQALVEPFIEGIKEYNLAGCKGKEFLFSKIEEPQKSEILDFDKKYLDFSRDAKVEEAAIDETLKQSLQQNFIKVYGQLFKGALIRCDFFVDQNAVYLNEINPIPGSMANYLFEDFKATLKQLSQHLPHEQTIKIDYQYINNIQGAKSKASS